VDGISALGVIILAYISRCEYIQLQADAKQKALTSSSNKVVVAVIGEQRIWKFPEELFKEASDAVDIVVEVFGVGKVNLR
jgi:heme/copper-type cytochrome/quinol oxidase subunit 2